MKNQLKVCFLAIVTMLAPGLMFAQPSAHYVPGVEGLKAASLPPPGVYLRDYNVFYFANRVNDNNGDEIKAADPDVFIYANVPRLLWITEAKLLGGYIGVDALLPLQYTDLSANTPFGPIEDSEFGVGDFFAEATWSWHVTQFDFSLAYGWWMPTGDSGEPADPGLDYWTQMFTAGATWYPDQAKKWALSVLNRYEINTEHDDADYKAGQAWTVEWGASYALKPTIDLGVVGYYQTQVTDDSGSGADDLKDWVCAVGPEINMVCPKLGLITSLRYLREVAAENRLQGNTVTLTLTKRF